MIETVNCNYLLVTSSPSIYFRGKCSVTLYSEIEKLYDYLEKEVKKHHIIIITSSLFLILCFHNRSLIPSLMKRKNIV